MRAIEKAALDVLDAGYDNGFGATSLDTILCEQMPRASREDFARFITRAAILAFLDGIAADAVSDYVRAALPALRAQAGEPE